MTDQRKESDMGRADAPLDRTVEVEVPKTRTFEQLIKEQRNGGLHAELSEAIADVAFAVTEHEKAGQVALVIKIAPGETPGTVTVADEVRVKAPEQDKPKTLFYTDDAGNLSRRNPRQAELPLDKED
jgi:hypothetical protein